MVKYLFLEEVFLGVHFKIIHLAFGQIRNLLDTGFTIKCAVAIPQEHVNIKSTLTSSLRDTDIAIEMPNNEPHSWHTVSS